MSPDQILARLDARPHGKLEREAAKLIREQRARIGAREAFEAAMTKFPKAMAHLAKGAAPLATITTTPGDNPMTLEQRARDGLQEDADVLLAHLKEQPFAHEYRLHGETYAQIVDVLGRLIADRAGWVLSQKA